MRLTLQRSCAACAKAKHGCDLQTPKCSRCVKRNCSCIYTNEPLTSTTAQSGDNAMIAGISQDLIPHSYARSLNRTVGGISSNISALPMTGPQSFDPFDSYPSTNLPRVRVQGLMYHFLSKIAFQYYPLDLDPRSNPFITSWWPLALKDPALFHVSLQTASLDDELQAQKGFPHSEILMNDCVSLIRQKVQDRSLAFQDATMNAVVTLAAIEHGKGNLHVSQMHIDGVKRMVKVRGGISKIKETSPLTARMVPWVSMLVMGLPQFQAQDDFGQGDGIRTIPQWQCSPVPKHSDPDLLNLGDLGLDSELEDIITRLRTIFHQPRAAGFQNASTVLSTTDLHDLTCYVLHRLLLLPPSIELGTQPTTTSQCVRYASSIYMFIIHGPTYYSHATILHSLMLQLKSLLKLMVSSAGFHGPLSTWLLSVGMLASMGTDDNRWFVNQAAALSAVLDFRCWEDIRTCLRSVLWLEARCGALFHQAWEEIIVSNASAQLGDG